MRKGKIAGRLLTIILSAAMVVTSVDGPLMMVSAKAETIAADAVADTVSENQIDADADETLPDAATDDSDVAKADGEDAYAYTTDETEKESAQEEVKETETETETEEASEETESEEEESLEAEKVVVVDTTPVTTLVTDAELQKALLSIYNAQEEASLTLAGFQFQHLKAITEVDLSTYAAASKIKSISGLGYAAGAKKIDVSTTGITGIEDSTFELQTGVGTSLETIVLPRNIQTIGKYAFAKCEKLSKILVKNEDGTLDEETNCLPASLASVGPEAFKGCTSLTKIGILCKGQSLQKATGLFKDCTKLQSVSVCAETKILPSAIFMGAGDAENGMELLIAENSQLSIIESSAFQFANIETVDLHTCSQLGEIGDNAFMRKSSRTATDTKKDYATKYVKKVILPQTSTASEGLKLGAELFYATPVEMVYPYGTDVSAGTVILPDYVTSLGDAAFYAEKDESILQDITLSAKLNGIHGFTFYGCKKLSQVRVSKDKDGYSAIQFIDNSAFYNTSSLTSGAFVGDMNRLARIGEEDLEGVYENLREQTYENYVAQKSDKYGSDVFRGSAIADLTLPASLRTIGTRAFGQNTSAALVSVTWKKPDAAATAQSYKICSNAFENNTALTTFEYTAFATDAASSLIIEAGAFKGCSALTEFRQTGVTNDAAYSKNIIPASLTKLGVEAFSGCEALPAMHISDNISGECPEIGIKAFYKCKSMTSATVPSKMEVVPKQLFFDAPLTQLPFTGNAIKEIQEGAFFGHGIVTVDLSGYPNLTKIDGYAFAYIDIRKASAYTATNATSAPMKEVILPGNIPNMTLGEAVFQGAISFDTMKRKGYAGNADGTIVMPDYIMNNSVGTNLFAGTAVKKVRWQFEDNANAENKWTTIPGGMFNAADVENIGDVLFANKDNLLGIGSNAFLCCTNLTQVDLTAYPNLEKVGSGAFSNCWYLQSIKLPNNGLYTKVEKNTFRIGYFNEFNPADASVDTIDNAMALAVFNKTALSIDFGGVTELGEYAFASFTDKSIAKTTNDYPHLSTLVSLDFTNTKITKIGNGAFEGNCLLETVNLTNIETIGSRAFESCLSLDMTGKPMADSVKTIGDYAFTRCASIGAVQFGSGLESIGMNAFEECCYVKDGVMQDGIGLTSVDFTKAEKLTEIKGNAFAKTALKEFEMTVPKVMILNAGTLSNCPLLQTIKFGENLKEVRGTVAYGCIALNKVTFSSTTTMDKTMFKGNGAFADENGKKTTPISSVTFDCVPMEMTVALGRVTKFPCYVMKADNTAPKLGAMYIGTNDPKPEHYNEDDVYQYVKVAAYTEGYYVKNIDPQYSIQNVCDGNLSDYYVPVSETESQSMTFKTETGVTVRTFDLYGSRVTPAGKKIPFTVTTKFAFETTDGTVESIIRSEYNLKVEDVPYRAELYTDSARTSIQDVVYNEAAGTATLTETRRAWSKNTNGSVTFWYDIKNIKNSPSRPDNCNLIIKSSNPDIMTVGGTAKLVAGTTDTWKITAEPYSVTTQIATATAATKNKNFTLTPKKSGDVTITVYPEGCPTKTTTFTYHVVADITGISLSVPRDFSNGVHVGDTYDILQSVNMYLNQSVSRDKNNLGELASYTDNTLTFTSSDPSILAIDATGKITVMAIPKESTQVMITATVTRPDGTTIVRELGNKVAYPPLKNGAEMTDASGATVKVTGTPSGTKNGTVTYTKPAEGVSEVTIPQTVVIDGATCDVTTIDKGAFKDNKTLKKVIISANIKEITEDMFKGCTNLESVTLPASVVTIGKNAFAGCKKLKSVTIPASAEMTTIGEGAFKGCAALTKIVIPKKVTTIKAGAFMNCVKLKTVTINAKGALTTIEKNAFSGCKVLAKITIPKKTTTIGAGAFAKCAKLKSITVKSTVLNSVGKNAFKGIYKKAVIAVPRKNLAAYKTLLSGKGQPKTVRIK